MSKTVNDNNRQGFFWHVHHEILIEWCHNYNERAEYIRTRKSSNEQETRLRLFQPVKGKLPEEVVEAGRACGEARQAHNKANRAYDEAYRVYNKTWLFRGKARRAYDKAYRVYDEAERVYYKAEQACNKALIKNKSKIEALHAEEYPNCPWDGHTIFPNA